MKEWIYKLGLRLSQVGYVRRAMDERAGLEEFRKPPPVRVPIGVGLIGLSFLTCWPTIGALAAMALYEHRPLLIAVGGPIVYVITHGIYWAGMWLSGEKYMKIFFRWAIRRWVERLLSYGPSEESFSPPAALESAEIAEETQRRF